MLALLLCCAALLPQGEDEKLRVIGPEPAVVTLGASCQVDIVIEGRADPKPPVIPRIEGADTQLGPSQTNLSQVFRNGRIFTTRSVQWTLVITPHRVGRYEIPPFDVFTGTRTQKTRKLEFEVVKEVTGKDYAFFHVQPSATRLYVHEPLRFDVDYGIDAQLQPVQGRTQRNEPYYDIEVKAAWLGDLDGAVPLAPPADGNGNDQQLLLVLNNELQRVDYTSDFGRNGRRFHRFQFTKSFLPAKAGQLELAAPVLRFQTITRRGRETFFGTTHETRTYYAYGEPLEIEVLPLPEAGRPNPFYGGVGRFRMSAALDKQRVKVGNSVKLVVTILGIGNTEFLRVPELELGSAFHLLGQTEKREPERVVVTYDLTPLSPEVTSVPGVAWNYFDTTPGVEKYAALSTQPLPLEVQPLAEGESLKALAGEERRAVTPGVDDIFDMKPITAAEPAPVAKAPSRTLALLLVVAPWVLCGAGAHFLARRARRRADVVGSRVRGALRGFQRAVAKGRDPADALIAYLADRLAVAEAAVIGPDLRQRLVQAGVEAELAREVHEQIDRAVAARYGGTGGLDAETARALVARLEKESVRPLAGIGASALLVAALLAPHCPAQASEGEAAYRRGDYAAAAEAFARAAATELPDGRVLYDLGNSLFRLGKLGPALAAYERARLSMPRDRELLANIRLVRQQLELGSGEGEPFVEAVAGLRASLTSAELVWLCALCHAIAAAGLVLGRGRRWPRVIGWIAAGPALLLVLEVFWFGPERAPKGIVVAPRADLVAEPRAGLDPVLKLREGVEVSVLSAGPAWCKVQVQGRSGYVPAEAVDVVRA
jgi:tetratricopeptide (TPR) repeat protein